MTTNEKYMRTDMKQKDGVPTTQDVLTHHLNCIGDIAGTMADYTDESRFFTPDGLVRGSEAVRKLFVKVIRRVRETGDVLRDAPAEVDGERLHRVEGRDGDNALSSQRHLHRTERKDRDARRCGRSRRKQLLLSKEQI